MKRLYLLLFSLNLIHVAAAQDIPAGARSAAMAHSSLTFTDIWSTFSNQAGLAFTEAFSAGVFYENRFLMPETGHGGLAVATPVGFGTAAAGFSSFGYSQYSENRYSLAYAMKLSEKFAASVQMNYQTLHISREEYKQRQALTASVGLLAILSEKVTAAAHIENPTRSRISDYNDERLPTILRLGVGYQISEDLLLAAETEKDLEQPAVFRAGLEYKPVDILYLRVGGSSAPALFSFGFGLDFKSYRLDLASTYHQVLGYSPQISFSYAPQK